MVPVPKPRPPPQPDAATIAVVLAAAARGDDAAWRDLLERYGRRVFALARSRCRRTDLAEEIAQSVFATVAAKLMEPGTGYTEQGRFESWLFRVTMNRVRDFQRRAARHATPVDPVSLHAVRDPHEETGEDNESLGRLREAMNRLHDADREVIELRHHGGLSFKQIAELLDEPLGTLLARHHRALRKLKELMSPVPGDVPAAGGAGAEGGSL